MAQNPPTEKRFWAKVSFGHGPDACWLWKGATTPPGYGVFRLSKKPNIVVYAHRYLLRLLGHEGEVTHHLCGNKDCVNPAHVVALPNFLHMSHHARTRSRDALGRFSG